jgi:integrase
MQLPPAYQAQVWSARDRKTIRKTFRTLAVARAWRAQAKSALSLGAMRAPTRTTVNEAAEAWLTAAKAGIIRTRSGEPYKPSALRAYEQVLRATVLPKLGHLRLSSVTRNVLQDLIERMVADGLSPSTVRNTILPLRAIYRRALQRSEVLVNPTLGLPLPASRQRRERIARPAEANALIEALPEGDRALWATALYAGLRRGELRGLRWSDVDFEQGVIRVERSWDDRVGPIEPKSRAGKRRVPLTQPLRARLAAHRLLQSGAGDLVFEGRRGSAFCAEAAARRARAAWQEAKLEPIQSGEVLWGHLAIGRSRCMDACLPARQTMRLPSAIDSEDVGKSGFPEEQILAAEFLFISAETLSRCLLDPVVPSLS